MDCLPASTRDHPVWQAIVSHDFGIPGAAMSFAQRLARENGWSDAFAATVIEEYRRFCFLAMTAGQEVTPSDAVDQAWHLHLSYSRDYWQRFCPHVLGGDLHHGPTAGGPGERARFFEQYACTLAAYQAAFGAAPPAAIWPDARRRLLDDPRARRVHPRDGVVLTRLALGALCVLCMALGFLAAWSMG